MFPGHFLLLFKTSIIPFHNPPFKLLKHTGFRFFISIWASFFSHVFLGTPYLCFPIVLLPLMNHSTSPHLHTMFLPSRADRLDLLCLLARAISAAFVLETLWSRAKPPLANFLMLSLNRLFVCEDSRSVPSKISAVSVSACLLRERTV